MAVRKVDMWQAVCDGCKTVAQECNYSDYWAWADSGSAVDDAIDSHGWHVVGDKHYCEDCIEYDEEADEYKPKEAK